MFLLLTTFSQISQSTRAYIFSYPMNSFHMHHYVFVFFFFFFFFSSLESMLIGYR
ncbi:hypothetical protein BDV35DRAFT_259524 [Aspergillus flavus]|uniref:Uncharacterized protein n=1 Tax=Aspergillus flavus TaxID=5059 RepID=A0A5N6GYC4_ASPFL|nr:hypothetical protein BDV35DRAFT_259524 [Aspergillus flavus]